MKTLVNSRSELNWHVPIESRHVVPEFEEAHIVAASYNHSVPLGLVLPSEFSNYGFIREVYNNDSKLLQDVEEYKEKIVTDGRDTAKDSGRGIKTLFAVERLFEVLAERIKELEEKTKMIDTLEKKINELEKSIPNENIVLERGSSGVWDGGKKYQSRKTRKNNKRHKR
jgi:hypothetical protein